MACSPECSVERRDETAEGWSSTLRANGFWGVLCSEEGCDDVRALVRRYIEGWSMVAVVTVAGMYLVWKGTPVFD